MRIALLLLAAAAFALQQPAPIPPYDGGDDDPHAGQPQWCQASDEGGYAKNCGICDKPCTPERGGAEDVRCKTSCRKGKCKCHPECHTR